MSLNYQNNIAKNFNPRPLPKGILKKPEKPRVLLIEDDRSTRRLIRATIKDECNLTVAGNANLGIGLYRNTQPHLVFLDIMLPDANGHALLEWIIEVNEDAFVVMMSGLSDNENVCHAINNGAKGFISKPFNEEKLRFFINQSIQHQTE